ncbi:MAG: protein kinase, partial [Candidatus Krumholzibacteria bacterium]|nr:protein kinase [Candidatus Krumholzibacteria bacterium]
ELRKEVESLLNASEADGPLDHLQRELIDATINVPAAASLAGTQISQYLIGAKLGGGGMGAVYRAEDQRLGRTVALKFLLPHLTDKTSAKQRFIHEAQAAARLEHPNICTILEVGESPTGEMFIAMPLYEGVSLRERLQQGPVPLPEIIDYARQICAGLTRAHEQGIVHRDIKPENIFVTRDGVLKILDFGIAKLSAAGVTGTGVVLGTLAYMSPEQARGGTIDHRSDIWSLGAMLYEMACGQAPFRRDNPAAMINAVVNEAPAPLVSLWPDAPPALTTIVERALEKSPAERFQTIPDLSAALAELLNPGAETVEITRSTPAILPEGERRLATILVTHIHDYDTIVENASPTELDALQEQMHQLVRDCVARHGGVVNEASGAEIISLFGVPTTHEDDVVRAVRAARAMAKAALSQGDLSHIALQSGIDSGYVVVQPGTTEDECYRLVGSTLHTAIRIAEDAGPSEVLVTQSCLRSIIPFYTVEQAGVIRLKGGKSCEQHRVLAKTGRKTRLEATASHRLTQFTGRSSEFEILRQRYRQALAGTGQFVSVVGDAGLGKSRFVHEFSASLDADAVTVLLGSCQSFAEQTAYYPFTDILRSVLGLPNGPVTEEQIGAAQRRLSELDDDLVDYFPYLLQALSIESDEYSLPSEMRSESLRATISEAVASLIICLTAETPVVLFFEDWHWVDAASADVLQQLVRFAPSHAILMVLTHRPGLRFELGSHALHTEIQLPPLDIDESSNVLHALLRTTDVPEDLARLIHERSGGNPFFLEEICESLLEQGLLRLNDTQTFEMATTEEFKIPDTVQGVIRARLDRMNRDDREVLCFASVIGRDFDEDILAHVYQGQAHISESLERLCGAGLIQPIKVVPRPRYRFKHALTQDVTYESLLTRLRQELHGLVGDAIVALRPNRLDHYFPQLALHFAKAERWVEAAEHGLESAKRTWRLTEFQESLKQLNSAEEWVLRIEDVAVRHRLLVPLLLRKERAYELFGARSLQHEAIDRILEILDPASDKQDLVEVYIRLGDIHTSDREFSAAEKLFNRVLALCDELGDEPRRRKTMRSLGLMMWHADRADDAIEVMQTAVAADRISGESHHLIMDLVNLSTVYRGINDLEACRAVLSEAEDIAVNTNDLYGLSYARHNQALVARQEGRLEEAIEILLSLLEDGKITNALPQQQGFHLLTCANIYLQLGRTEDALASWERGLVIMRRAQHIEGLSRTLVTLAEVELGLNRPREARDHLIEAKAVSAHFDKTALRTNIFYNLGIAHAALQEYPDAIAAWGRARTLCRQQGNKALELDVVSAMARTTRELVPEASVALQHFGDAVALAGEVGDWKQQGALYNTMGIIEWQRGDYAAALTAYQASVVAFDGCGDTQGKGLALSSVGVTLHKMKNLDAAARLQEAVTYNQEHGHRKLEGFALAALGDVHTEAGHPREAIAMSNQSLGILKEIDDRLGEAWMLHNLARVHSKMDALDRTRDFVTAARKIAIELDNAELLNALREISN